MSRADRKVLAALCAGGVAVAALAAETIVVQQPFAATLTDVAALTGDKAGVWTGYGSVTNQTAGTGYAASVGTPIAGAADKLYLSVEGQVTCTAATTANQPATVDMMIQIARPDEDLALPSGEATDDIQIAVGVEKDGTLKVFCKDRKWYALGAATYEEGAWHRVSFTFDYANKACQIRLDGEPLMSANGTLTADGKGGAGAWYKLNTAAATNLSSVQVVGATAIDEVVVKSAGTVAEALPALADADETTAAGDVQVPNSWIAEQGITRKLAAGEAPDGSGMTVADKYQTGLPVDGTVYAISAMKMTGAAGAVKATLTVPKMAAPAGRRNVVVYGASPEALDAKQVIEANATTVELSVGKAASGVTKIYYQLRNEAAASNE